MAYRLAREGIRYSHIIDPRTGLGTTNELLVTVTGPSAMVADGLASAACVGGGILPAGYSHYAKEVKRSGRKLE